jgi:uncharacterized protein
MNKWIELLRDDNYIGIKKYIKDGADINETNESGESVLAYAMRECCSMDTVMLLIENGADKFDFDDEGVSILDMAVTYNNVDMLKYLLKEGVDINQTKRRSGFTALMAAACYGRVEIAKILISNGVNQEARDMKGFRAVDFARKMNKKSVLELLDYEEFEEKNRGYAR